MNNRFKTKIIKFLTGNRETRLIVQVADTPRKREKGLMFVGKLPENEGMLFEFPGQSYGGFWMKNTFIPLSIAYLDFDGKILEILDMEPCKVEKCPIYDPGVYYYYAVEVNIGWFDKNQIKVGDIVKFN